MKNFITALSLVSLIWGSFAFAGTTEKTLNVRSVGEPASLDWNIARTNNEGHIFAALMEGLVKVDANLKVHPAAAERWEISKNRLVYTFYLRKEGKWSDGKSVQAQDFVYSWRRLLSASTASTYAYFLHDIVNAQEFTEGKIKDFNDVGIKALNATTLQVTLKHAIPYFIYLPSFWVTFPMRADIVEKHGTSWWRPGHLVTNGPFQLISYDIGVKLTLQKNTHYRTTQSNLNTIQFHFITYFSTALNLFDTHHLDLIPGLTFSDIQSKKNASEVHVSPLLKTVYLGFISKLFAVNNPKTRQAVCMAIDKKGLVNTLGQNEKTAAVSYIPEGLIGSNLAGLKFNVNEAKKLLASIAGKPEKIKIELLASNSETNKTIVEYIQFQLKKNLGIEIDPFFSDYKTFHQMWNLGQTPLVLSSWTADYPDTNNFLTPFVTPQNGQNILQYSNPNFDKWIHLARTEYSTQNRTREYQAALQLIQEKDAIICPLFHTVNYTLASHKVKGWSINALNGLDLTNARLE